MRLLGKMVIASGIMMASHAHAGSYGMAGCGLGSLVFKEDSKMQILAATTNGTSGSQTFGITSGTSNCTPASMAKAKADQESFVTGNLASLSKDMARGEGDSVVALAALLGCQEQAVGAVAQAWKASYSQIFAQPGAIAVLHKSTDVLKANPEMAKQCGSLI